MRVRKRTTGAGSAWILGFCEKSPRRLKIPYPNGCAGSSPAPGTRNYMCLRRIVPTSAYRLSLNCALKSGSRFVNSGYPGHHHKGTQLADEPGCRSDRGFCDFQDRGWRPDDMG